MIRLRDDPPVDPSASLEWSEELAQFVGIELGDFEGGEVAALAGLVEPRQIRGALEPGARRSHNVARED